jgi:hypothetical protein
MQVSTIIGMAQRASGILGVGQTALPQDQADAQALLTLMLMQWRQARWLVFRLDNVMFPVPPGIPTYTVGPETPPGFTTPPAPPAVVTHGNYRPANVQSCYLRQAVGSGPNSFPIDFPMQVLESRQQFDQLALKSLTSWPSLIYYDPTVPYGTLYIWPIPMQPLFSLYIGFQQAIDMASEEALSIDFDTLLPAETQLAIMYNLALILITNYGLPVNQGVAAAARASLNTLRKVNFALQPLRMPSALRGRGRMKNPMGGFYPELAAGIPTTVLS